MTKDERAVENSGIEDANVAIGGGGGHKYGLAYRIRLLKNKVFFKRYILDNAGHSYSFLFGFNPKLNRNILAFIWRASRKIAAHVKIFGKAISFSLRLYYIARFLAGKVDMPQFEIVLTTKCTLHCEGCDNMMQYFSKDAQYTCTLGGILASMEALFKVIDSVQYVYLLGGEPLLHKDLVQVVRFLRESPKVREFAIFTNGTLEFKEDVLDALEGTHKALVIISDYKASPNLSAPLRHEAIVSSLKERKIAYQLEFSSGQTQTMWNDPGRIYKRGRPKEDVIKNYLACMNGCVSVMSAEGAKDASLAPLGAAFVCPKASSLSRLKGLKEFEGDFIDFATANKQRILEFYAQDYYKACDYCCNKWEEKRFIPPAVQTKEVFRVEEL